jgi:hypothetical protein
MQRFPKTGIVPVPLAGGYRDLVVPEPREVIFIGYSAPTADAHGLASRQLDGAFATTHT